LCAAFAQTRPSRDISRSTAAFWQSASLADASQRLQAFDRESLVVPLIDATRLSVSATLAGAGERSQQLTRVLRDALQQVLRKLQYGQIVLATVGAIAPFVGLLGTVWGIYQALIGMASAGQITIERIAGPVGEALVMTAAGLAVAIPAVMAYNLLGRRLARLDSRLEGLAFDLRALAHAGPH
jgi:biopolymer transport protein ExbB